MCCVSFHVQAKEVIVVALPHIGRDEEFSTETFQTGDCCWLPLQFFILLVRSEANCVDTLLWNGLGETVLPWAELCRLLKEVAGVYFGMML